MEKLSSSTRSLAFLGLGMLFAAISLSLAPSGKKTLLVCDFRVKPAGGETLEAAFLSSRQGQLLVYSTAGADDNTALKLATSGEEVISAEAADGLIRVEISPPGKPDGPSLAKAVEEVLKRRFREKSEEASAKIASSREALEKRVSAARDEASRIDSEIFALVKRFPGEFDERLVPTGATQARLEEISFRLAQLKAAASGQPPATESASEREDIAALERELEQMSETLGPFHPKMKALEKRLASLRATRVVHAPEPVSAAPAIPLEAVSGVLLEEQKRLRERLKDIDEASARMSALVSDSIRVRAVLSALSRELAGLPEAPPVQEVVPLGQHERTVRLPGDGFPSSFGAFLSVLLGAFGAVSALGSRREQPLAPPHPLPRVLLDLSEEKTS